MTQLEPDDPYCGLRERIDNALAWHRHLRRKGRRIRKVIRAQERPLASFLDDALRRPGRSPACLDADELAPFLRHFLSWTYGGDGRSAGVFVDDVVTLKIDSIQGSRIALSDTLYIGTVVATYERPFTATIVLGNSRRRLRAYRVNVCGGGIASLAKGAI